LTRNQFFNLLVWIIGLPFGVVLGYVVGSTAGILICAHAYGLEPWQYELTPCAVIGIALGIPLMLPVSCWIVAAVVDRIERRLQ
jgi:hypothetical protein